MDNPAPAQVRAARAMLDWSKVDLAKAAGVSVSVVMRAEGRGPGRVPEGVADAIRAVLERAGVRFVEDDGWGMGIMLRSR